MAIISIARDWGFDPSIVRITSTNDLAAVGTAGYLTAQATNIEALNAGAFEWVISDFVLVYASDGWGFYSITPDFTSLDIWEPGAGVAVIGAPVVVGNLAVFQSTTGDIEDLGYAPSDPTKTTIVMAGSAVAVNHIAKFIDTAGTVDDTAGTAINSGNIQAGLSGTAGTVSSFPATAATGSLILAAVSNSGNTNVTLSNALHAQASVYSIPDSGASTANFIISKLTGTQHITVGSLQVDAGNLLAGSSGVAGTVTSFPATAANGSLILQAVNAGGAFNTTLSNGVMGQSTTYTIPDILASTGDIVVSTTPARMKWVADAAAAGGSATQSFTDAFCTAASVVLGFWQTQANAASILTINPGAGSFSVVSTADAGVGTFNYLIIK